MEIILLQDMDKLGTRGQVVKVADGYARNYLLPQKQAVAATPQNLKWLEQQRVRFLKQEASEKADAADLAKLLADVSITETRKAGEQGTLFGSVTAQDIADKLAAQGYKLDRRKIQLDQPIKVLGEYNVSVKLHREVIATVKVKVEPDEESKAKVEAAAAASAAKTESKPQDESAESPEPEAPVSDTKPQEEPETKS